MRRAALTGAGASALAAAWMVAGAGWARAEEPADKAKSKPKTRVQAVRVGGGAHLGVVLDDVDKDDLARLKLSEEKGALVKEVRSDSPAAKAGLAEGDVIVEFQGQPVWSAAQLSRLVRETPPGRTVTLEVLRDGSARNLQATLAEGRQARAFDKLADLGVELPDLSMLHELPDPPQPPDAPQAPRPPRAPRPPVFGFDNFRDFDFGEGVNGARLFRFSDRRGKLGIQYEELSEQLAGYFKVDGGVLVSTVEPDGPAAKAGIKAGDVVVKVDGKAVRDGDDLRSAVSRLEAGQEATLGVQRDGRPLELKLTVGGRARRAPRGPTT
jgi:serine protease Do